MHRVYKDRRTEHAHTYFTDQQACVSGVSWSVVQETWEAEVGDLADQVAVDQDIAGGEVSVNVVHVWQVLHPCSYASQHPNQLCHGEASIIQLRRAQSAQEAGRERKRGQLMTKEISDRSEKIRRHV